MKFHRNIIWIIPLFTIITSPLWSIPVSNFLAPRTSIDPAPQKQQADTHDFNMEKVNILQHQDGRKTAVIRARKAHTGKDPNLIIMELVIADIFDEEGNITNIIANTGKYDSTGKLLTLTGDVVVHKTLDNQFLYTDLLYYDSEQRTINCPGKTRLEGENVAIDGGSLDYDIKSQSYIIDKGVTCILEGFINP
jgi:LPS export ABC transporter protein LptC